MSMNPRSRYFAQDSPDALERERLALLTDVADPITTRRLSDLGVGQGWRCLEVGAGDGSVARWLAGCVGPGGRVVATDVNPRFLIEHGLPNLEVRQHNILEDELEAAHYDLVHCRFVLQHLPDSVRGLRRLFDAVRPGGWLLVEEFDIGSLGAADPGHPRAAAFEPRARALWAAVQAAGPMDPTFGRRLPALVEQLGLQEAGNGGATLTGRGGGPLARFTQMTNELLRSRFVATGALTEEDFDQLERDYDDPSFWFVGFTLFGAWGRRPRQGTPCRRPTTGGSPRNRKASLHDPGVFASRAARTVFNPQLPANELIRSPFAPRSGLCRYRPSVKG
jgi:SAM-dependent methyltransferase